ncbi:MAG: hypothetical protein KDC07_11700 [Chitinophagaceae bacterium]|nr:hypothetical protein [Chitinophagaceae bacterium]MCB9045120.1 hypothetical protein [Chitinophagales bacterium]
MKHLLHALVILLLCVGTSHATPPTIINLSKAIEQHIVTVNAETTGSSYNQQALKLTIKNTGSLTFNLVMNPGVIFRPDSAGYQPLILAGEEKMYMTPLKENTITVQTFCADSRMSAPAKGISYTYQGMGNDTLVKALYFIKQNRIYNILGQSAVWMFTNGHSLNQVYDPANEFVSKKLMDYLINITGRTEPQYYVQTTVNNAVGEVVYDPKTLKIFAKFEEQLDAPKKLTLGIYNENGEMIQSVFEDRTYGKAGHRFRVEFEAIGVDPGKYYIRLKEGDAVLRETMVEVK